MGADVVNLSTLRSEVESELTAAGFAVAQWSDAKLPPAPLVIVDLGDPYVQLAGDDEKSFGARWVATIVATLITGRGPSDETAAELDSMIGKALAALVTLDYTGTIPGDGVPAGVEVQAPLLDKEMIVGALVSVRYPLTMKG